jgi:hypothetical protein
MQPKPISYRIILAATLFVHLASSVASSAVAAGPAFQTQSQRGHYIVFEKSAGGRISPLSYRAVELSAPLQSLTDEQVRQALERPFRDVEHLAVSLQTAAGQVVYRDVVPLSTWLRGEFQGRTPGAPIDGHLFPLETVPFVVRVPQIEGALLILSDERLQVLARFDLAQLAAGTPPIRPDPDTQVRSLGTPSVSSANRVDFLVMGDGYTAGQSAKFSADASAVASQFFSISPYSTYRNYFKLRTLFTPSLQAGADHPPYDSSCAVGDPTCCTDPVMQIDPLQGQIVDTAFDDTFCFNGIHRLLVPDYGKVLAAAASVPDWESILLVVNDPTYGGSGAQVAAVLSMNSAAPLIAQHEYGHSFVGLADEYDFAYPGFPPCSDLSGAQPCEPNVTDVTARALIKWSPWILPGTPIPTPNNSAYAGIVGLFRGARYQATGMYRPGYSCIMRFLGEPFCQVPSQAFVLRLYEGRPGSPAISLIEPGSPSPSGAVVSLTHPATQVFKAGILRPAGGPPVGITWLVDGKPVPGAANSSFTYVTQGNALGVRHVTLLVRDVTPLVHPAMAGNALQDKYVWKVIINTRVTSASAAALDGWVRESAEIDESGGSSNALSPLFLLGDDAQDRQYRALLSFNTGGLPDDAVITSAALRFKKFGQIGADPFSTHGQLLVDVRKGAFGGLAALQRGDFQAPAGKSALMTVADNPVNGWYSRSLPPAGLIYINKTGLTQFRLRFAEGDNDDGSADNLRFYSGNTAPANRPVLVIKYYIP